MQQIPLVDLKAQYHSIKNEIDQAVLQCIENGRFIGGEPVLRFEEQMAGFCNLPYCAGCGNGTDALEISLKALGIGKGDEVIVPAMTFIASAEAVVNVGAEVKFCDISGDTCLIDPLAVEKAITPKTKAVIAVHLYGQMADMEQISKIAKENNLFVIEDSAQAIGAKFNGKGPGHYGDLATFSFFPGKNLGAYGDAGAMVTKDEHLYATFKKIANHGRLDKFGHEMVGRNSRLDTLQASILSVKIKYLEQWTRKRQECTLIYTQLLGKLKNLTIPKVHPQANHVFHLFVIRVDAAFRDQLVKFLQSKGISTGVHYPQAVHETNAFNDMAHQSKDFPEASLLASECISLPIYPEMTKSQIEYVCSYLQEFFND